MFAYLKKLFGISEPDGEDSLPNFIGLPGPSKKAIAKREKKVKQAILLLGDNYMNVPFKKSGEPETVTPIRKLRSVKA